MEQFWVKSFSIKKNIRVDGGEAFLFYYILWAVSSVGRAADS